MQKRKLGKSGIEIAPLVFGGNVFGWTANEKTSFDLLDRFLDQGFNCVDTADVYSVWVPGNTGGDSEKIIGAWMKKRGVRDRVVVVTKVGQEFAPGRKGLARKHVLQSVDESLKRLQTDYIDVYLSHIDDEAVDFGEKLETYASLEKAGKIRAIGASNFTASRLKAALDASHKHGYPRYEVLQPHYSLMERFGFEGDLAALCMKEGLGVITYYSLASGFLTGKYRSKADTAGSARAGNVEKHLNAHGHRVLDTLDAIAADRKATPAQVALAWLMHKPGVTAPIASATSLAQLDELMRSTTVKLDKDAIHKLDVASG